MKKKIKPSKLIFITIYFVIWAISIIVFWFFTSDSDAMGYSIVFLWGLLPVTTFVLSLFIGKNDYWGKWKWIWALVFGLMYMLAEYATFRIANMVSFNKISMPQLGMIPMGAIISIVGLAMGVRVNHYRRY